MSRLSLDKVLEVESHCLSINNSALILGVLAGTLHAFIKKNKIHWRGKKPNFKTGEKDNNSQLQKTTDLGINNMTVFKRMERGMSYEDAINTPVRKYNKKSDKKAGKITKEQLLELSTLGISRRGAASILGVSSTLVNNKVIEFGIDWLGKPCHNAKGQRDPNAIKNKCELLGLNKSQVYEIKRRYKVTLDEALEIAYSKKLKKLIGV